MIALHNDLDGIAKRCNAHHFHFGAFDDAHFLKPLMNRAFTV